MLVVMGGVSRSDLEPGGVFNGTWTGLVTTENNGGFAGIRTKLLTTPINMDGCKGMQLKVVGDGQSYKFILRDDENWNGVAWSFSFRTVPNKEITIKIPFSDLKPTRFARIMSSNEVFNKSRITAIQLSLSKFEYDGALNAAFREGRFQLTLKEISTF
jgi:hypothetical protein